MSAFQGWNAPPTVTEAGFYWVKRNEPDGPSQWEVADFDGTDWWFVGDKYPHREVATQGASNQWKIGPRLTSPEAGDPEPGAERS